jgi:hypothetical protein
MIERLFELAGIKVDNDLLLEAAYDGMVNSLKQNFPNNIKDIDDNLKQAKTILTKQDRIVWYLKVLRAYLSNNINQVSGDYNFSTIEQFNTDLFHYYGYNIGEIQNTQLTNQNISELFETFQKAVEIYQKSDKPPVPVQHGDYELIKCNDGTSWWFVDRAFCEEEGRSGKHCGNVTGKYEQNQRILSLRNTNHNVILTFILEPNGFLGEMKAKANLKPSEKYHPNIMQLLLNPIVKGIKGAGYAHYMNFSIFDLSEQDLQILIKHGKESFIANQIESEPIEFLKAPQYIKNNKEYQQIAIKSMPALTHIINNENDLEAWEQAIHMNPSLIIYAPDNLKDFKDRVISYLNPNPSFLIKCPKNVVNDFDIVSALIEKYGNNLQYVMPNNPNYSKLAMIAIEESGTYIKYVPENTKDYYELAKAAVKESYIAIQYIPSSTKNYYELCKIAVEKTGGGLELIDKDYITVELCNIATSFWGYALEYVPFDKFTPKQQFEICKNAVSKKSSNAFKDIPKDILASFSDEQVYELCEILIKNGIYNFRFIPDKFKDKIQQQFEIPDAYTKVDESLDFKYFQTL